MAVYLSKMAATMVLTSPKSDLVKIDRKFMFMTTVSAFVVYSQ